MNTKKKVINFLDKQGFYVVLAVCLLVIAITAVITITQISDDKQNQLGNNEQTEQAHEANFGGENMQLQDTTTQQETKSSSGSTLKVELAKPVEGEVITKAALNELIYNETLEQWSTHNGIDIACLIDSPVKSVLAGTVEDVKEDDLKGMTVIVSHENGYKSIYCNMNKEVSVKKGDKVKQGQTLGKVGKTALQEYKMEPHLHFELMINEENVDPLEYIVGLKTREVKQETTQE